MLREEDRLPCICLATILEEKPRCSNANAFYGRGRLEQRKELDSRGTVPGCCCALIAPAEGRVDLVIPKRTARGVTAARDGRGGAGARNGVPYSGTQFRITVGQCRECHGDAQDWMQEAAPLPGPGHDQCDWADEHASINAANGGEMRLPIRRPLIASAIAVSTAVAARTNGPARG